MSNPFQSKEQEEEWKQAYSNTKRVPEYHTVPYRKSLEDDAVIDAKCNHKWEEITLLISKVKNCAKCGVKEEDI